MENIIAIGVIAAAFVLGAISMCVIGVMLGEPDYEDYKDDEDK